MDEFSTEIIKKEVNNNLEWITEIAPEEEIERESKQIVKFEGENLFFDKVMSEYLFEQLITEYLDPNAPDGEEAFLQRKFQIYDNIKTEEARAQ